MACTWQDNSKGDYPVNKRIEILQAAKRAIRAKYAWPGGYPLYLVMHDGEAMSIDAARENWHQICCSHITNQRDDWQVLGVDINWDQTDLLCCHTNEPIESAYGESN